MENRPLAPPQTPPPHGYAANPRCDFHAGSLGHTTDKCLALKFKVQDLLDRKVISFAAENPNVKNNPMLGQDDPPINALEKSEDNILIQRVYQVKTYISRICEILISYEVFKELLGDCKICWSNLDKCENMKRCLQQMMNQGLVQMGYSKKIEDVSAIESHGYIPFEIPYQRRGAQTSFQIFVPMSSQTLIHIPVPMLFQLPVQIAAKSEDPIIFYVLAPFPYTYTKFVPWNYATTVYVGEKPLVLEPTITNIIGFGAMTQSGRAFAPE